MNDYEYIKYLDRLVAHAHNHAMNVKGGSQSEAFDTKYKLEKIRTAHLTSKIQELLEDRKEDWQ